MGISFYDIKPEKTFYILLEGTMYNRLTEEGVEAVKVWCLYFYESDKSRKRQMTIKRKETEFRDLLTLDLKAEEIFKRAKLAVVPLSGKDRVKSLENYKKVD